MKCHKKQAEKLKSCEVKDEGGGDVEILKGWGVLLWTDGHL